MHIPPFEKKGGIAVFDGKVHYNEADHAPKSTLDQRVNANINV